MKRNERLLRAIGRAVQSETPDVLPQVLLRLQEQQDTAPTTVSDANSVLFLPQKAPPRAGRVALRRAGGIAAALAIACAGIWAGLYRTPQSVIGFDVNPSIELHVSRSEKVLSATPLNADASAVLDGMNLKNTDLDVAVNALIGSMVKNGYISEMGNSILISVDSTDKTKGAELQQRLSSEVGSLLDTYAVSGAVLSQTVSEDDRIRQLAQTHGISAGKAALVDQLVSQDPALTFSAIAALPINDINLLLASRQTPLTGVEANGQASSSAYIGEEKAQAIALKHAGVQQSQTEFLEVKMDYDDGRMEYDIEFYSGGAEFEYEIDAVTGSVLSFESEARHAAPQGGDDRQSTAESSSSSAAVHGAKVSNSAAEDIALAHAGEQRGNVSIVKSVSYSKQGRLLYDIIFLSKSHKHRYEIDANTGDIIANYVYSRHEDDRDDDSDDDSALHTGSGNYIGGDRAGEIAFAHAGVDSSSVRKFDCKLDDDDGHIIYEVEFVSGGMEYEYEIDAVSGDVLWWESEKD